MSDVNYDEMLLDGINDEDLDYDLDPKEESALLQEEADSLEPDDVLDINVDYDQMDVADDKSDSVLRKLKIDNAIKNNHNIKNLPEKINVAPIQKSEKTEKFRRVSKGQKRIFGKSINNTPATRIKRSKTVLINPRFKGPVHVNGRQIAWESPPAILNESQSTQPFVQPWANGNIPTQSVSMPQFPMNQYNHAAFVPSNPFMYMQTPVMQPPIVQPPVFFNQQPPVQMNHCTNQYRFQPPPPPPPVEVIQQVPEPPKLPVHQRLGVPQNHFNQLPTKQIDDIYNNRIVVQDNSYNNFPQTLFQTPNHSSNLQQMHMNDEYGIEQPAMMNNKHMFHRNKPKKNIGNEYRNNNSKVVNMRKQIFNLQNRRKGGAKASQQKQSVLQEVQKEEIKPVPAVTTIQTTFEDEDEETRTYRLKIEEQKKKREEILRKKEESRLKNLSQQNKDDFVPTLKIVNKPVIASVRNFQQRKPFYHMRQQQNHQSVKHQNYTNNIVITGNDSHNFGQWYSKTLENKVSSVTRSERIVTSGQVSPDCAKLAAQFHMTTGTDNETGNVSSFLSNRSVIAEDDLAKTNIVVVKNLASTTTVPKIMKLCRDIGKVQKIQMEKKEHRATIHFNTIASAHTFYNKFRRCMIDLSMIQVDLVPCEGSS